MTVTDEDYHLTFGLHSGIPLCCAIEFSTGGKGGPCPPCQDNGITREELFASLHKCHENNPSCAHYLELIELRTLQRFQNFSTEKPTNLVEGEQDDYTWGESLFTPMGDDFRYALKDAGYRMVHLCWPGPSTYWYIFQQPGGKTGVCGACSVEFSLAYPSTGKKVR